MAPVPSTSSPAKGKARVYLCRPCGSRHAPPTGLNCRLQRQKKARSTLVGNRRSTISAATRSAAVNPRRVGRPRKSQPPALARPPTPPVPSESEDSEDDSIGQIVHAICTPPSLPRPGPIPAPRRRPLPAPRRPSISPRVSPSYPSSDSEQESHLEQDSVRGDLSVVLDEIAQMRLQNAQEIRRLKADARSERARLAEQQQREREFMTSTILAIQGSVAALVSGKQAEQVAGPSTPCQRSPPPMDTQEAIPQDAVQQSLPSGQSIRPTPQAPRTPAPDVPVLLLQGQPPVIDLTPQQLAESDEPIKSLRRDDQTSDVATILLREVGLEKVIELDKARKGKAKSAASKLKLRGAKWPNDYIIRLDDDSDPTYDSLNVTEFVSRYLSIIEEVTPVTPQNARLLQHLDYLRQLMDDCASSNWDQVRMAHRQVLASIELNRLKWDNVPAVKEAKAIALQRVRNYIIPATSQANVAPAATPCALYQKGQCLYSDDHTRDGKTSLHCCSFCFKKGGKQHTHTRSECKKSNRGSRAKNGKQASREKE